MSKGNKAFILNSFHSISSLIMFENVPEFKIKWQEKLTNTFSRPFDLQRSILNQNLLSAMKIIKCYYIMICYVLFLFFIQEISSLNQYGKI